MRRRQRGAGQRDQTRDPSRSEEEKSKHPALPQRASPPLLPSDPRLFISSFKNSHSEVKPGWTQIWATHRPGSPWMCACGWGWEPSDTVTQGLIKKELVPLPEWGSFPRVMLAGRAAHPLASDHTPVQRKWCPGPTFISAFLTICDPTLPLIGVPYLLLGMPLVTCTRVLLAENVWEVVKKILETRSQQWPFLPRNDDKQVRVRVSNARDST